MSFKALVTKSLKENNKQKLQSLPTHILPEFEARAIAWALEYEKTYGVLPTVEAASKSEFRAFITESLITSPMEALYDEAVAELIEVYTAREYASMEVKKLKGETIKANDFLNIAKNIQKASRRKNTTIKNLPKKIFGSLYGTGLPIGIPFIDDACLHFPGMYSMFFGGAGNAKTYLFNYLAAYQLLNSRKILVVRGEMTEEEYIGRIGGIMLKFNSNSIMQKANDDPALATGYDERVADLFEYISDKGGDIIFTEHSTPDVEEIKFFAEEHRVEFVLIDGTYQLKSDNKHEEDMKKEGRISNELRDWAKDGSMVSDYDDDGNVIGTSKYYPRIIATTQMNRVGMTSAKVGNEHVGGTIKYAQDVHGLYALRKLTPWEFQIHQTKARRSKETSGTMKIDWDDMKFGFEPNGSYSISCADAIKELCNFEEAEVQTYISDKRKAGKLP